MSSKIRLCIRLLPSINFLLLLFTILNVALIVRYANTSYDSSAAADQQSAADIPDERVSTIRPTTYKPTITTTKRATPARTKPAPTRATSRATKQSFEVTGIPKVMHYVFTNDQIFEPYKPFIKSCLDQNPDWKVLFWSDKHSEEFIDEHYHRLLKKYRDYRDKLEKSDAVRYMILHKLGGVYVDMDVECRKPFSKLLTQAPVQESIVKTSSGKLPPATAFLSEERREQTRILYGQPYSAMNSLMGSRPKHPFFARAIDKLLQVRSLSHPRITTGPEFLTNLYRDWIGCAPRDGPNCQANEPVLLYPDRLVSPVMDTALVNWEKKCQPYFAKKANRKLEGAEHWKAAGCSQLVFSGWDYNITTASTAMVHHFLHMGYGDQKHRKKFNLFKEFPRFKTFYS